MKTRIRQLVLGAALAAIVMGGGAVLRPSNTLAAQFHCHNLNRVDYWVMTGIVTDTGGVFCHGSV